MDLTLKFEEDIFPIILCKVNKNFQKQYDEILKPFGLSKFHGFYLLCLLKYSDGLRLNELNEIIGCDKANTSRAIADLEEKKIICRETMNEFEKKYVVKLTNVGFDIANQFYESSKKNYQKLFNKLSKEEQDMLYKLMIKLLV